MRWGGWCGGSAGALDWCEWVAQVVELLTCASQFVVGVLRARRAVPSAGAGEWVCSWSISSLMRGA